MSTHQCDDPNCDSLFHKGDLVEVKLGDTWVAATVTLNIRTRVNVRLETPVLLVETTISKRLFVADKVATKERFIQEFSIGAGFVRHQL